MLEDALRVGVTRDKRLIRKFLAEIENRLVALPYGRWKKIGLGRGSDLAVKFKPAGHILGSSFVECRVSNGGGTKKVTFSGDLGAPYAPLLPAPRSPYSADMLVLESTEGVFPDRTAGGANGPEAMIAEKAVRPTGFIV